MWNGRFMIFIPTPKCALNSHELFCGWQYCNGKHASSPDGIRLMDLVLQEIIFNFLFLGSAHHKMAGGIFIYFLKISLSS
jgi:hypothetical protein